MKKIVFAWSFFSLFFVPPILQAQIPELQTWLVTRRKDRPELSTQSFAKKPLSKKKVEKVIGLLGRDKRRRIAISNGEQWQNRLLWYNEYKMPFFFKTWGEEPVDGRSLFLSLHGGGGASEEVNDKQYENQKGLYDTTMGNLEGVYLAMRAPTDTWDLWHQPHIDEFINLIIQLAVIYENVNPNKVYILGYSAGGDGVYQLAPRLADRWAAASMMAGHPGDASALNLRNTPFSIHVGELDSSHRRNEHATIWKNELDKLEKEDPEGYKHLVAIPEGKGHWMKREDSVALPWMAKFVRNPAPSKVVWKQDNVLHNQFYWLEVPEELMEEGGVVVAEFDSLTNEINIEESYSDKLIVKLNDSMLNLDKPVTVKFKGKPIYQGRVRRNILTIWESLAYKGDINLTFSSRLLITINKD